MRSSLKAYKKVTVESSLTSADPHQIISMMYNGLLESVAQAKGAISRKDFGTKGEKITKAISILRALQNSLDRKSEPVVSQRFADLYGACIDLLIDANVSLDIEILDQVIEYISPLRDAWVQISVEDKAVGLKQIQTRDRMEEATGTLG